MGDLLKFESEPGEINSYSVQDQICRVERFFLQNIAYISTNSSVEELKCSHMFYEILN